MSPTEFPPILDLETCPCSGGTLDKLVQPAILAILAAGSVHGYRLAEQMSEMPLCGGKKPDPSGVYRFLKSMEGKGLVTSAWDLSDHGPAKKSYRITESGRTCLAKWIETLEEYHRGINSLLETARQGMGQTGTSNRAT